jgi:hypothetical protein
MRLSADDNFEPLIALTAAASVTERVRLLTSVLLGPLRANPALFAKQAASLDRLSSGRLVLGMAVGGRDDDFQTSGLESTSAASSWIISWTKRDISDISAPHAQPRHASAWSTRARQRPSSRDKSINCRSCARLRARADATSDSSDGSRLLVDGALAGVPDDALTVAGCRFNLLWRRAVLVRLVKRLPIQVSRGDTSEVGTSEDVFMRTVQGVLDGRPGSLRFRDCAVEFGELAARMLTPFVDCDRTRGDERLLFAERKSDVPQK